MNNIYKNFTFVPKCSAVHSLSQRKILLDDQLCLTEKKKNSAKRNSVQLKCQEQNVKFIYYEFSLLHIFSLVLLP